MRATIGLGGNLAGSRLALRAAMHAMAAAGTISAISSLYRSAPRDRQDQPDFLNAALALETNLRPHILLDELQATEHRLGRDPSGPRFGPRLVDLDILAIDDECITDPPTLVVPHPRLAERRFALEPLAEMDPDMRPRTACPGEHREVTVAEALAAVMDQDVEVVEGPGWVGVIGLS